MFPNSPGYYSRPKRNRKQWLCKVLGGKQGELWSMWKWWILCLFLNFSYPCRPLSDGDDVGETRDKVTYPPTFQPLSKSRPPLTGLHVERASLGVCSQCSFKRIQKRISDPRFAGFRGRKEREIRHWICDLGNLSQTRAICMTASASQEMTFFLLFDKLCDYTVQNFVVGSSNNDDGTYWTDQERRALKLKII